MDEYIVGEYIIYRNGEKYELGRIKSLREDGAFVAYHEVETGALTPYDHMHKLINRYCIKDTTLGGEYFLADTPQTERMCDADCNEDCTECAKESELWQTDCTEPIECKCCTKHICYGCEHQAKKEAWRKAQADCGWR